MANYYLGHYTNGFCGCDITYGIIAETYEQAVEWMENGLYDYGQDYEYIALHDLDEEEDDIDSAVADYYENLSFYVEQVDQERYEYESNCFEDLTS